MTQTRHPTISGICSSNLLCHKSNLGVVECWEYVSKDDFDGANAANQLFQNELNNKATAYNLASAAGGYGLFTMPRNGTFPTTDYTPTVNSPGIRPTKWMKSIQAQKRCVKKTRIKMEPGSSYVFRVMMPGFRIAQDFLYDPLREAVGIGELTKELLWFMIGEKAYDNSAGEQGTTYATASIHIERMDSTSWRMRPKGKFSFNFTTRDAANFEVNWDNSLVEYAPTDPNNVVVGIPRNAYMTEQKPEDMENIVTNNAPAP